ncbi:3-hydroxyacyl-ACP dehydratase FabZ, partial [Thermodesulfobacteriota bacterium]
MEDIVKKKEIDIQEIMRLLPHRYPFLLVDRITSLVPRHTVKGIKNVTVNEPFFQGHFPDRPVFPGVLILEGMAQVGGCLAYCSVPEMIGERLVYF